MNRFLKINQIISEASIESDLIKQYPELGRKMAEKMANNGASSFFFYKLQKKYPELVQVYEKNFLKPSRKDKIFKIARKERVKNLIIKRIKKEIKNEDAYKEICKKKNKPLDIIDKVNINFIELDVSARTANARIDLNEKLLDGPFRDIMRYIVHEITHVFQQIDGDVDEGSANKSGDDYLADDNEEEAFGFQVDYMKDHYPDMEIVNYLEQLLDHHKIFNKKERKERIRELTGDMNKVLLISEASIERKIELFNKEI